jgi:hypothetical protein
MRFSQRIGQSPIVNTMQLNSMNIELRNGLWNVVYEDLRDAPDDYSNTVMEHIWRFFYKETLDSVPRGWDSVLANLKYRYQDAIWLEVYDFIDFYATMELDGFMFDSEDFQAECNKVLEMEFAGYRFIDGSLTPITDENEMESIKNAIESTTLPELSVVSTHLLKALHKLSDRHHPDYRNSIKESISAVESLAKIISGGAKDTLGASLDKIKGKLKLHPSLERGFKLMYGYTSDSDGIRHALTEESTVDFEDAKYMLVSCTAFINYLIVKAEKAQ